LIQTSAYPIYQQPQQQQQYGTTLMQTGLNQQQPLYYAPALAQTQNLMSQLQPQLGTLLTQT